jgi:hypothetical protein
MMALFAGWEDLNDADQLRNDSVHQNAAGSDVLASAPTRAGSRTGRRGQRRGL